MKCRRCGRELTNKKAIELGCGPLCYKKVQLGDTGVKQDEAKYITLDNWW